MDQHSDEEKRAEKLAGGVKKFGTAGGVFRMAKAIALSAAITAVGVILLLNGGSLYLAIVLFAVALMITIIQAVILKRIATVDLEPFANEESAPIELPDHEIIQAVIPAVMRVNKVRSVEVMGRGKVIVPENILVVTNEAIWALTVPLEGVDKVVSGTDIGKWQWTYAYEDIVQTFEEMHSTLPIKELFEACNAKKLMNLNEVESTKVLPNRQTITIKALDGRKIQYAIRRAEDFELAKEIFKANL